MGRRFPLPVPLVAACVALAACSLDAPAPTRGDRAGCALPGEQRMTVVRLYFGSGQASDAAWDAFAARVVTAQFPDGFTVTDGAGQWRNPATGGVARERSKVLEVAVPAGADIAAKVAAVSEAYKAEFHQQSVGVVTFRACGAF